MNSSDNDLPQSESSLNQHDTALEPLMAEVQESEARPILSSNEGYGSDDSGGSQVEMVPSKSPGAFLVVLTLLSALGGFLFGYDTGVMSGALILIREVFQLSTVYQELLISITIAAAAVFSLLAGVLSKKFGRRPVILFASLVFTIGALVQGSALNAQTIAVGRVIVGIGIGIVSMTVPVYIAECAPTEKRGILVVVNNLCITAGQIVSALVDGAFSYDHLNGWRYMLGLAGVPSAVQFVGFWFLPESPRWLVISGRVDSAAEALRRIRGHSDIEGELEQIRRSCVEDRAALESSGFGSSSLLVQIFCTGHVRRALFLGCGLHIIQQVIGINTIIYIFVSGLSRMWHQRLPLMTSDEYTWDRYAKCQDDFQGYYTASIIESAGFQDTSTILWISAGVTSTNFVFSFVGVALVEKIGRRKLTACSLKGVALALVVVAVGFQLEAHFSPPVTAPPSNTSSCSQYRSCYDCTQDSQCGFCRTGDLTSSCDLRSNATSHQQHGAEYGPCTTGSLRANPSYKWIESFCPSPYSWITIIGLVLYLMCFAPGMGPMPWTINSEIYPLWARSTAVSFSTTTHWVFNIVTSMTFLSLLDVMTPYGVFWMYASCACLGLLFIYLFLPETKGRTLEEVEELFMQPWC